MRSFMIRKFAVFGLVVAGALTPAAALADTLVWFNDGNGYCGYMSCGANGCQVIDIEYCPDEVSGN